MNPVDDFLSLSTELGKQASTDLRQKQTKEMELWHQWHQGGKKPDDLRPLMHSLRPFVNKQANLWANRHRDIPPGAIRAEFTNQLVQALETYNPNRGAQLNTHIQHQLKKAQRFVTTYQNPARIPENRTYRIRELQDAESRLDEQFGRPPNQLELADHLKWSPRQIDLLQREIRKSRPTGQFSVDPATMTPSRHQEVLRLLPYDLTPDERSVFEYLYGIGGKPQLEPGQIAQRLGMSAPKVSRLKKSIATKYQGHMG
jgi:DNA-directed RNA polymerase specialized sigma subunit